jgi:dTDP-4-dehydrorhamnose reductase
MLRLSETRDEVRVVDDQHGRPTSCIDLSRYISSHIDLGEDIVGGIYHFSSPREESSITWADFAEEIFRRYGRSTRVIRCSSAEYPTKARRPEWSVLL